MYLHAPSQTNQTWGRIYSPSTGTWRSRDPMDEKGGINLYDYVCNDPIDLNDPLGLCGVFLVRPATVNTDVQTNPLSGNVVGGPGYEVRFYDQGCCPNGHIKLVQALVSWLTPLRIDGKPVPGGLPDSSSQSSQASKAKSFIDSPGMGSFPDIYTVEVCAVCQDASGHECPISCVTFKFEQPTGELLSGSGPSEGQPPGSEFNNARKKYHPAPPVP